MTILELLFGIGGIVALVALVCAWIVKANAWVKQLDIEKEKRKEVMNVEYSNQLVLHNDDN